MTGLNAADLFAVMAGAVAGTGMFLLLVALRGLPPRQPGASPGRLQHMVRGGQPGHQTLRPGA